MTVQSNTKELAPWQPGRVLTEADAQKLTVYLTAKAERDISEERKQGSKYPKAGTPAHEACIAELAYRYASSWVGAGEASQLQLVDWIEREGLYFHHPRQWETLGQMLNDIAESVTSESGRSIYSRIASDVLPYLREHEIADTVDLMGVLMEPEGGKGKLYHALPLLTEAIQKDDAERVKDIIGDVKDRGITRSQMLAKWRCELPIPPASAELRLNGDGTWQLTISMTEEQKRLIIARLGERIEVRE